VIRGPGAFVEAADDWRDFAAAMERKLLREVLGMAVAREGAGTLPHP
jgi:Ca-activated chloride channel homolog